MADQTLMERMKNWFRSRPVEGELVQPDDAPAEVKNSLLHPFAKRDAAIQQLQSGFVTLTDLMTGIRENLERQGQRNDELMQQLSRLPGALESLPESTRIHGETLRALHQELSTQNGQQQRIAEILDQVSKAGNVQKETLDGMQDRMDRMRQTDEQISANLQNVGSTMQELGRSTSTGAQILESLRDNMASRDNELQQVLLRQGTRFTVMLSIAIFLSIAALLAVAVMGYLVLMKK
jgi:chromosome segregation ATPase